MQDRPREKVLQEGIESLSNAELLALLMRSGSQDKSVIQLAQEVLNHTQGLKGLRKLEYRDLIRIHGIKQAKACEIMAVGELARRMAYETARDFNVVDHPRHLIDWLQLEIGHLKQEHFVVVFLNTKNHILGYRSLFTGSLDRSIVHPREVFKWAVSFSAARIIAVHNHPSGDVSPSENDYVVTQALQEAGEMMGIPLLDHLIVSEYTYRSMILEMRND